jgi:RNA polymerase sigma factor (sigma-70 family)
MIDAPDAVLLEQFTRNESEEAFTEIVRRHIGLVHSVALRHTQNAEHAKEITQAVFIILARKASSLGHKTILSGWLYHTARLTAANFQRAEFRRARREQEVFMQTPAHDEQTDSAWLDLGPLLEEAMSKLGTTDRDVIVLRFFENKTLREVGRAMGLEERAAQKRVARGLEKLRAFLTKRGVVLSATLIASAVSANSVKAASPALAASVKTVAFVKGSVASASTLTLVKGALKIMAWTKAKTAVVTMVVMLAAAGTTTMIIKKINPSGYPGDWIWTADSSSLDRVPPIFILRPTRRAASASPFEMFGKDRYLAEGKTIEQLLTVVYSQKDSSLKLSFPNTLPVEKFDCIIVTTPPEKWWNTLESKIDTQFNLTSRHDDPKVLTISKKSE